MDLFALDALVTTDGQTYILELNGTSIGLGPQRENEDNGYIADLLIKKLSAHLQGPIATSTAALTPSTTTSAVTETKEALHEVDVINVRNANATLTHRVS
jgi:hypothetical protein